MRVFIAGAGSVGRSIARELLGHGHEVVLMDRNPSAMRVASVAEAEWILADACELDALRGAEVGTADVVVAATGDDKANLVLSLLAKTEFGVPRTVARVNNPKNEWMFDEVWGVDVPVSTPRFMTALVEEAVSVGGLVRVFRFHRSGASLFEITLPPDSPVVGRLVSRLDLPTATVLAAIVRGDTPLPPSGDHTVEAGDKLLLVVRGDDEDLLARVQETLAPVPRAGSRQGGGEEQGDEAEIRTGTRTGTGAGGGTDRGAGGVPAL